MVGVVIDDAIIVLENIERFVCEKGNVESQPERHAAEPLCPTDAHVRGAGQRPVFNGGASFGRLVAERSRTRRREFGGRRCPAADQARGKAGRCHVVAMLSAAVMLSAAAKQVVAAEQAVTLVQREVELTEERLAAGVADNLEVFQAQSALSQVRAARIQALAQHVMARVNWALALGTIEQFQW